MKGSINTNIVIGMLPFVKSLPRVFVPFIGEKLLLALLSHMKDSASALKNQ
jgi:hypothetical protein